MAERRIKNKMNIPKLIRLQNKERNRTKNIMNFRIFHLLITIYLIDIIILSNIHLNLLES